MNQQQLRHEVITLYRRRSVELFNSNVNGIADKMCEIFCEDTAPFEVPEARREEVKKFQGTIVIDKLIKVSPERNELIRKNYLQVTKLSTYLILGPFDIETGKHHKMNMQKKFLPTLQRAQTTGFDIEHRIFAFDKLVKEFTALPLDKEYICSQLIYHDGINGSVFTENPKFTNYWKGSYTMNVLMRSALEVIMQAADIQYFGGN